MPSHSRHLSLVVLLALLIVSLPAALPAHAQNMVVNSTADTDDGGSSCASGVCTLRKALRLANVNAGSSDMITFSVSGTINVTSALPTLADGGTTISGPSGHTLMLDGEFSATNASGLEIASANNTVRGLVISGFPGSNPFISGSGILIHGTTATGNTIANNWIGLSADGASAVGNQLYGVMLDDGAHGNLIGGSAAGEGNVIAGNWSANVAVYDTDGVTTGTDFIADNQIIGNNIGTNAAGTGVPTSTVQGNLEAGIRVGTFARNTLIKGNRIGGHIGNTSTAIGGAGILLQSSESVPDSLRHPQGTTIVGNDIGATPSGGAIDNTFGILFVGSAINTVIGDPTDLVGGRNVIGNSADSGIVLRDNSVNISGTQIVGNYIGLARNSTAMAPILAPIGSSSTAPDKAGIYLGTQNAGGPTTIGPGNVIAAVRRYGIRVRSDGNTVKGNLIGTDPAGTATSTTPFTSGTSFGLGTGGTGVWVENGSNNLIGGSSSADRNVIAIGGSGGGVAAAAIALRPNTSACSTCVVSNTTVQGNYLGVNVTGDAALANPVNSGTYGILISSTSGNTVRGNVISGAENGIILGNTASTNTIDANKIGTRASGSLAPADAIGNTQNGVYIVQGTGNQITNNLIAFNGVGSTAFTSYHGIDVASTTGGANNNTISGNRLVANGINPGGGPGYGSGIFIDGPTGILITQSATSGNKGEGIRFGLAGSNGNIASPTLSTFPADPNPAVLSGSAAGCGSGCTVEVFTSPTSDPSEGPIYLTSGTTTTGGAFSIAVPGCQRYLSATVRDTSNNTSRFSNEIDAVANTACVPPVMTLAAATPNSNSVGLGSSTTYTHKLTNGDSVARTYTVVIDSSRSWASGPSQVTVSAGATVDLTVVVSVPADAAISPSDTTTVQVFLGTFGSSQQTDTTTATLPSTATPAVSPGQTKARSGTTISFTHSVTNTGGLLGTFAVVGPSGSGSPTIVGTPPTGWAITSATLAQTSLAGGASTTLTIAVNTPAGAPAGPVQLRFIIKEAAGAQTSVIEDTITVPVVRSFTFAATNPTGAPPTLSRPPGAAADFVYTVTNTGNASDTFQVTPPTDTSALAFSVSPSASFALGIGATRTVTVTAQVAAGSTPVGPYDFSVSAVAVGGPTAPAVDGRVTVVGGGSPLLVFGASSPSSAPATGGTLDFVGTLTNTGNADVPFTLGTPALTGSPAGWSAPVLTGSTCPNPLVMGDSCTFTLRVTVPSGANGGAQAVTISATADNSGISGSTNVTVSASVSASVDILRSVSLGAAAETSPQTGMPTQVLTFTHTLTNLGNVPDSFTISLSPTSPASVGMAVLSPTSFTSVARNATRTITLVVTVPSGVLAGTNLPFVVTATSQGSAGVTASQTDTATVGALDAAQISPGTSKNGLPGTTLTFTHTLTNTGSTLIDYTITATNSQAGFSPPVITSGSQILSVSPGVTKTVTIQVILPTDPSSGTGTTTTVQVTKSGSATVLASATDTARVGKTYDVVITPNRTGVGYPKTTLVFTHTVTNIGINTDTYTVAATNSLAWSEGVSPDLFTLGPGASQIISVMIDIPNDNSTIANARNFGRVRVVSRTKPDDSHSEAVENITVGQTAEVDLSGDEARAVTPHSGTIRMSDLVLRNNGNGDDTFDLIVSGADSGWSVDIISFDLLGPHEIDYNIMARVGVPANVAPGITKTITIVARSRHSQAVVGEVRLRFIYIAQAVRIVYQSYLPIVAR